MKYKVEHNIHLLQKSSSTPPFKKVCIVTETENYEAKNGLLLLVPPLKNSLGLYAYNIRDSPSDKKLSTLISPPRSATFQVYLSGL